EKLGQILEITRDIAGSLNLRYVLRSVGAGAHSLGGFQHTVVWLLAEDAKQLVAAFDSRVADGLPQELAPLALGEGLAGRAARFGRIIALEAPDDPTAGLRPGQRSGMAVPMTVGARIIGVLELWGDEPHAPEEVAVEVLETLSTHAALAIEAARLHQQTEEWSQVDPLTRLLNRRRLDEDLQVECERSARYGRPVAFLMMDVDHFKRFN